MSDVFDELSALLKEAGLRVTFDVGRNNTHPCTFCAESKVSKRWPAR